MEHNEDGPLWTKPPFGSPIPAGASLFFGDRLEFYLTLDTWPKGIGVYLLVGILPEPDILLGSKVFYRLDGAMIVGDEIDVFAQSVEDTWLRFESDPDHGEVASPTHWIEWAVSKGLAIPWLEWARHKGLIPSTPRGKELPKERQARIAAYVDRAYASGKTKESAYKELADLENCGTENIKRIYKSAKKNCKE